MSAIQKIQTNPFLRIILPVVLGIVAARHLSVDNSFLWMIFAAIYVFAWMRIGKKFGYLYVVMAITLCSAALYNMQKTEECMPTNERLYLCLEVTDAPQTEGRWHKTSARIGYYRRAEDSVWQKVDQKMFMSVDTCYEAALGEQFVCRAYVNPFDKNPASADYVALMKSRGFVGRFYVTPGNLIRKLPADRHTPIYYAKQLQNYATQQIMSLRLSGDQQAIATSIAAGERRGISRYLNDCYARIGATHLLAVSGLNVAIIFAFINILLYFLPFFRSGHIVKNICVIVAIWFYAAMAGLSPSVVRAAMMFSGAQIALASSSHKNTVNIMLGTAVVMLLLNPNNLYDISFQLSFVAVLFILLMFPATYAALRGKNKLMNLATSAIAIGVIACGATIPLVSYKFGIIPIMGIVIGPLLVVSSNIILFIAIAWVIMPLQMLSGVVSKVLEVVIQTQNELVVRSASFVFSGIDYKLSLGAMIACYAGLSGLAIWIWTHTKKETFTMENNDCE